MEISLEDEGVHEWKRKICLWMEKVLPFTFYRYLVFLRNKIKWRGKEWPYEKEYFLKYRPFSKKKYYIARFEVGLYGIMAVAQNFIFVAERARSRGMQPVVLWQWICDFRDNNFWGENVWEVVFKEQKVRSILDENATILVSDAGASEMRGRLEKTAIINDDPMDCRIHAKEDGWREYYKKAHKYAKKYWRFNGILIKEAQRSYNELFQGNENVLGVALREEFSEEYNALLKNMNIRKIYRRHPSGPNVDEILNMVETSMEKWGCNKIFVASMYSDSIEKFEERFPDRVIYCKRTRVTMMEIAEEQNSYRHFGDNNTGKEKAHRDKAKNKVREYVLETLLLSKCAYMIGATGGQTIAALTLNGGKYKDIKILEDRNHAENY